MQGKTVVITGCTSGIGEHMALDLAGMGAQVVLAGRSQARLDATRARIAQATGSDKLDARLVELSAQASIRAFAAGVLADYERIDVLINNAGLALRERTLSEDGIEKVFATNVLAYFLLTELLLERMKASAPARIVVVASDFARELDLDDVQFERRKYKDTSAYSQSKRCNRLWTWALARRLAGTGGTVNAMTPGFIATGLYRDTRGLAKWALQAVGATIGRTVEQGAETGTWLASSPQVEAVSGKFWRDKRERSRRWANEADEERLWRLCEQLTAVDR